MNKMHIQGQRQVWGLLLPFLFGMGVVALWYFNPIGTLFFPKCIVYTATGLHCFGCGSGRAVHALLHLDITTALRQNIFLVLTLPFILYEILRHYLGFFWEIKIRPFPLPKPILYSLPLILLIFVILRNLPYFPFTLLAPILE
ncbi:DUF2752 domain-containing protein [Hugenholtzia roseola]|uniref:DUF2752 domain-containing protein n=1 Tax=Hugenholtzia roseola TaxID=1002 RepID=UPI0003FC30C5|nr:DUF2752 domain-containing protein [Hugenholtzia roseola]